MRNQNQMHAKHPLEHRNHMVLFGTMALLFGLFLRTVYLDADPAYYLWSGYVTDEGRWTEQARSIVLFGSLNVDSWLSRIHLALSPFYQTLTALSFSLLGVSFPSARAVSAMCGGLLLVIAFRFLRYRFTPDALLFSMAALALQPDLLFLSRVAIPETPAMLFEFLAFAALIAVPRTVKNAAMAGIFTGAAIGMKATVAPIAPIFVAVLAGTRSIGDFSSFRVRVAAYLGTLLVPAITGLGLAALVGDGGLAGQVAGLLHPLVDFLRPASMYGVLSFLFYGDFVPALNVLLLGAGVVAGLLIAVGRLPSAGATAVYLGSAIWVAGWVGVSACLDYFPARYVFHALVPLILHLGAGLTLVQTLGYEDTLQAVRRLKGPRRAIVALTLSLPMAALLCPPMIVIADLSGFTIDRFREQMPLLVTLCVALALAIQGVWRSDALVVTLVTLPPVAVLLWFGGIQLGIVDDAFWGVAGVKTLATWVMLLALAAAITAILLAWRKHPDRIRQFACAYLAAFIAIVWLWPTVLRITAPSYTIANASADLERLAAESTTFGTGGAASLFLGNGLRYTEQLEHPPLPEMLVVAFDKVNPNVLTHYRLVRHQELNLGQQNSSERTLKIYQRTR